MAKLENEARRRMRNKSVRSVVKTCVARAEESIGKKETEAAQGEVVKAISVLDNAAKKGVIHPNQAARRKSRLVKKLNQVAKSQE